MANNIVKGYCKECGTAMTDENLTDKDVYECSNCGHPHLREELWDQVPDYLKN